MVSVPPLRLPATGGDGGTLAGLPPPSSTVEGHDSAQAPPTVSSGGPPPALVSGARPAGGAGLANPDPRPHDGVHDSASDSEAGASGVGGEDDASDGAGSSRSDGAVSLLSASTGSTGRAFRKAKERLDQLRQEALERNLRSFQIPPGEEVNVLYPSEAAVVSTFAGTGEAGCRNGRAEDASFNRPQGVAVTPWTPRTIRYGVCGVVYVSDTLNHVIRKIDRKGTVSVFAGDGKPGYVDGNAPIARFYEPCGLAVNSDGDVFVCDRLNNCVRKIEMKTRKVTTFVGNGRAGFFDGGKVAATFNRPHNVCCDRYNNLFVTDFLNNRVRRVTPDRKVTTVVGDGAFRHAVGRCAASRTAGPMGVAADSWGNVYFTDQSHRVSKLAEERVVYTLAGSGHPRYGDGFGELAHFNFPSGVCVDHTGVLFVCDTASQRVRVVEANGSVRTLAGSGRAGRLDGVGVEAEFNRPCGIAVGPGFLLVADQMNNRVRKITVVHPVPIAIPEAEPDTDVDSVNSLEDWYRVYQAEHASFDSES